ncbi:LysE family translocator [Piscinibacter terrae]|uniref:LysE family translocator n=1 Tax=Piscinibacter terrae TaxID=2496871 RepID=A0A3N7IW71_9BURK|nr:LysE family translocator [Albitalea terrae]RQP23012.1 LysE family translocator [Albitalea terrae]
MDFLPPLPLLIAFCGASVLLAVTPGPAVFYIITRSLAQGRRAGLASVAGVALGNLGNALGAALGLAALFAISSIAFTVVKYAGAAYLIYLGIKALRRPAEVRDAALGTADTRRIFRDGFLVALLNPKTAIFFAAFLPQFMSAHGSVVGQSLLLGATFVAIAALTDTIYATAAGTIAPRLRGNKRAGAAGRYVTASAFIGLGLFTALSGSSRAK